MWDTLSRADIEAAKKQLTSRREQMLRRHAEELEALVNDRAELDTLDQLIDALAEKFSIGTTTVRSESATTIDANKPVDPSQEDAVAGVSFFITQAQKLKLRELGMADDEIRKMKPDEAHRILGIAS